MNDDIHEGHGVIAAMIVSLVLWTLAVVVLA